MLNKIQLTNFKPYGSDTTEVECAPITLIYGPNSSGKSSIIQSLLMMAQTFSFEDSEVYPLITSGKNIELGVFSTVIHKHEIARDLQISLELGALNQQLYKYARDCGHTAEIATRLSSTNDSLETHFLASDSNFTGVLSKVIHKRNAHLLEEAKIVLERSKLGDKAAFEITAISNPEYLLPPSFSHLNTKSRISSNKNIIDVRKKIIKELSKKSPNEKRIQSLAKKRESIIKNRTGLGSLDTDQFLAAIKKRSVSFSAAQRMLRSTYLPCSPVIDDREPVRRFQRTRPIDEKATDRSIDFLNQLEQYLINNSTKFERTLRSLTHITPLRDAPTRVASASNIYKFEENAGLLQRINEMLRNLELPYSLAVEKVSANPIFGQQTTLVLHDHRFNTDVTLSDVGFGMSQLIPIIREGVDAYFQHMKTSTRVSGASSRLKLLLLEQPEIHLHPKLQANLAELFWSTATLTHSLYDSETLEATDTLQPEVQWIIETHSEAILLRLQKLIRQKRLSHQDVSILYVDVPKGSNAASVTKIELDDKGDFLTEWPGGFFEERIKEMFD